MAQEKFKQEKKIVNLESNVEKIKAGNDKTFKNLLKISTEVTEVKSLCKGPTNFHENKKKYILVFKSIH